MGLTEVDSPSPLGAPLRGACSDHYALTWLFDLRKESQSVFLRFQSNQSASAKAGELCDGKVDHHPLYLGGAPLWPPAQSPFHTRPSTTALLKHFCSGPSSAWSWSGVLSRVLRRFPYPPKVQAHDSRAIEYQVTLLVESSTGMASLGPCPPQMTSEPSVVSRGLRTVSFRKECRHEGGRTIIHRDQRLPLPMKSRWRIRRLGSSRECRICRPPQEHPSCRSSGIRVPRTSYEGPLFGQGVWAHVWGR